MGMFCGSSNLPSWLNTKPSANSPLCPWPPSRIRKHLRVLRSKFFVSHEIGDSQSAAIELKQKRVPGAVMVVFTQAGFPPAVYSTSSRQTPDWQVTQVSAPIVTGKVFTQSVPTLYTPLHLNFGKGSIIPTHYFWSDAGQERKLARLVTFNPCLTRTFF